MVKTLLTIFLFCNAAQVMASQGYHGTNISTTAGTAEQRLAGLFCNSVDSATWDTCTVTLDGPNTQILVGNGANVSTLTATDLYIATVTATYIVLNGQDLETWLNTIGTSTTTFAAEITALSASTVALRGETNNLSASTTTIAGDVATNAADIITVGIATGTLRTDAALLVATQTFSGQNTFLNQVIVSSKVGIGTISPDSTFHIKSNVTGAYGQIIIQNPADDVDSNAAITAYESDGSGDLDQQLWYVGSASAGNEDVTLLNRRNAKLTLGTDGTTRITILGNGNVGVKNTNPATLFQVGAGTLAVTVAGNVGIGTTAPSEALHVIGDILGTSSVTASAFFGDGSHLTGIASGDPDISFSYTGDIFDSTETHVEGLGRAMVKQTVSVASYKIFIGSATTDSFDILISTTQLTGTKTPWTIVDTITVPASVSSHTVTSTSYSLTDGNMINMGFWNVTAADPAGDITIKVTD